MLPAELAVVCPMGALAYGGYLTEESPGNIFPYHAKDSSQWKTLAGIHEPLLAVFGGADAFIKPSPQEAAKIFKEKAAHAKHISVHVIDDASHSYVGFEDALADIAFSWVKKIIAEQE